MTLKNSHSKLEPLKSGDKVIVVGGGPAGSFFAIHLLREARESNRCIDVTIVERKKPLHQSGDHWIRRGCNFCAGGISPRLYSVLKAEEISVPPEIIQEEFSHIWIQGLWKNVPLKVSKDAAMLSVFRGSLPHRRADSGEGFDSLLLKWAH
jgi:2-polyprenyl-6-methoxyphenol hydroxylase-like FAD-dependent oxidoreductase